MDNIAWYRKYRPSTMEDYLGDNIKQVVKARFGTDANMPSVIMIHGSRGCGKTTFARIVSKYYLCENKVDGKPCEQCEICQTINDTLINGETGVEVPGVVEIDNTTANGKGAIQSIIEDAIVPPIYTKKKILIMDECHMITNSGQNSILKIIEDIPSHLVVLFCTTDPEKVIQTIHSRCQLKLEVRKKSLEEMTDRLEYISKKEGLITSKEALKIIAKKSDRVPRESINLLESIAKANGNNVTLENVRLSVGSIADDLYLDYFISANKSLEDVLMFNKKIKELDIDAKVFISGLNRFILDCLYIRHGIALEDYPTEYVSKVGKIFKLYTSTEFDMLLQVIEYASKLIGNDESKNELIITTTALRIGKVGLLANGLGNELSKADKENKKSIMEYKRHAEMENANKFNNAISKEPVKEGLIEILEGMRDVAGTSNISIEVKQSNGNTTDNSFVSTDDLESMLDM